MVKQEYEVALTLSCKEFTREVLDTTEETDFYGALCGIRDGTASLDLAARSIRFSGRCYRPPSKWEGWT
jgi:hypothetical protein